MAGRTFQINRGPNSASLERGGRPGKLQVYWVFALSDEGWNNTNQVQIPVDGSIESQPGGQFRLVGEDPSAPGTRLEVLWTPERGTGRVVDGSGTVTILD